VRTPNATQIADAIDKLHIAILAVIPLSLASRTIRTTFAGTMHEDLAGRACATCAER
jgi:hypothetical protein